MPYSHPGMPYSSGGAPSSAASSSSGEPASHPSIMSSPGPGTASYSDQSQQQTSSSNPHMTSHHHLQGNGSESFYPPASFESASHLNNNNNSMRINKRKRDPLDPHDEQQSDWVDASYAAGGPPPNPYSSSDPYSSYGMEVASVPVEGSSWTSSYGMPASFSSQGLNQPHHHHHPRHLQGQHLDPPPPPPPYLHHEGLYAPDGGVSSLPPMSSFARGPSTAFGPPEVSSPDATTTSAKTIPGLYPVTGAPGPDGSAYGSVGSSTPVSSPPSWTRMVPVSTSSVPSFANVSVTDSASGHHPTLHPMVS